MMKHYQYYCLLLMGAIAAMLVGQATSTAGQQHDMKGITSVLSYAVKYDH